MGGGDRWSSPDKVYHVLFCFSLAFFFSSLASRTRYPFLRRHAIWIGSIVSLLVGAAKEAADELGFFGSAGASAKDALADLVGVIFSFATFSMIKRCTQPDYRTSQAPEVSIV